MRRSRWLLTIFLVTISCNDSSPRASGTKTDWFLSCESVRDCGQDVDWSCLCGMCTVVCADESGCERGVCGSIIATAAACGSESEFSAERQRICLPDPGEECVEAPLTTGTALGETVAVSCGVPGALLCEDFEGPLPQEYSTWRDGEASAGLQECEARGGSASLRFTSVDDGYTQTRMRLPTPVSTGAIYVRFYLRVETGGVFPEQLILLELWDQEEGLVEDRTTLYLISEERLEVFVGAGNHTLQAPLSTTLTRDEWHCIELGMELSDTLGTVGVRVEDEQVIEGATLDTLPSDPLSVAVLESLPKEGSQSTKVTFFLDDFVVATEPIGCD
jgi:hypothetical protein